MQDVCSICNVQIGKCQHIFCEEIELTPEDELAFGAKVRTCLYFSNRLCYARNELGRLVPGLTNALEACSIYTCIQRGQFATALMKLAQRDW